MAFSSVKNANIMRAWPLLIGYDPQLRIDFRYAAWNPSTARWRHASANCTILASAAGRASASCRTATKLDVVKGADHPCDIAQRRTLAPTVRERPRRRAFKIDDKKIVFYDENLTKVEISMKAGLMGLDLIWIQSANLPEKRPSRRASKRSATFCVEAGNLVRSQSNLDNTSAAAPSSSRRHSATSSALVGLGAKSGSSRPCSANARCISAVRSPS
jgi:hypothetical protein